MATSSSTQMDIVVSSKKWPCSNVGYFRPSHQKNKSVDSGISRTNRLEWTHEKDRRLSDITSETGIMDDRIAEVEKLLGEESDPWCKHCKIAAAYYGHAESCPLRRINPEVLRAAKKDAAIKVKKNENRQRIFKQEPGPRWNGIPAPSGGKTLVKRRVLRKSEPSRELKYCKRCKETHLFVNNVCCHCQHAKRCSFEPNGKNCQTCYPNE